MGAVMLAGVALRKTCHWGCAGRWRERLATLLKRISELARSTVTQFVPDEKNQRPGRGNHAGLTTGPLYWHGSIEVFGLNFARSSAASESWWTRSQERRTIIPATDSSNSKSSREHSRNDRHPRRCFCLCLPSCRCWVFLGIENPIRQNAVPSDLSAHLSSVRRRKHHSQSQVVAEPHYAWNSASSRSMSAGARLKYFASGLWKTSALTELSGSIM